MPEEFPLDKNGYHPEMDKDYRPVPEKTPEKDNFEKYVFGFGGGLVLTVAALNTGEFYTTDGGVWNLFGALFAFTVFAFVVFHEIDRSK